MSETKETGAVPATPELSIEEADNLVLENQGWAESIARAVAKAWNLDWRHDGLDGAAMEALIFCARRFQPSRGVPFRGYARRRIHEASTEAARRSRGWRRTSTPTSATDNRSREVSFRLFEVFPELRDGQLPLSDEGGDGDSRGSIRQLIVGAALLNTREMASDSDPEALVDLKNMVRQIAYLEPVHQALLWRVYWEGLSLRTLASEWGTDGLNVIREHKILLAYLFKSLSQKKQSIGPPKVRPGLRQKALEMKKLGEGGPFTEFLGRDGNG